MRSCDLWRVFFSCPSAEAERLASLFEEEALSASVFSPPRKPLADVELIFAAEPDHAQLAAKLAIYEALSGHKAPSFRMEPVGNLDWIKKVAEDFPPLPIGPWTIYGASYRAQMRGCKNALQIDATSAFGTGEHPTTRGCLLMLTKLSKRVSLRKALDMGCGSGILAMAFAKRAHGKAVAVDCDGPSVRIARDNARANGVRANIRFETSLGYRSSLVKRGRPYDLVLSNIFARPLCLLAKDLKKALKPQGYAILAGLLISQEKAVLAAHRRHGLNLIERIHDGEWSILLLQRG